MKLPKTIPVLNYGAEALVPATNEVLDLLTLTTKYDEPYTMFRRDAPNSPSVWIPRGLVSRQDCPTEQQFLAYAPTTKTKAVKPPHTPDQAKCIVQSIALMEEEIDHVIESPTGSGKSLIWGTKVVLYSGFVKEVQDICLSDTLIGPDSTPRKVSGLHKSMSPIYRITPVKGEPFECNDVHILSLKCTGGNTYGELGSLVNVEVKDWLKWPKYKRHCYKLWRAPAVEFPHTPAYNPYLVGLYLADGTQKESDITCGLEKQASLDYLDSLGIVEGKEFRNGAWRYFIPSFRRTATLLTKDKARTIPDMYLRNSVAMRLQLLAGLLDGDGYLHENCFEIACKDEQFKDQLLFLCRSLGLAAYAKYKEKGIKSIGFKGMYWIIQISGDVDKIPTKIPKKQAHVRGQKKDALVTGFKAEYVRDDYVYGFCLDQDHLYLLNDFTVTHNTYIGCVVAGEMAQKTLIIVTKNDLIKGWKDTLIHLMGIDPSKVGHVQQDQCKYQGCDFVVAMIHSLVCREYEPEFYRYFGMLVLDEVHRLGADYFVQVCAKFPAARRLGLSVGPDSVVELRGGPFQDGWVGRIEDATTIVAELAIPELVYGTHLLFRVEELGIQSRGWTGTGFAWKVVKTFIKHNCTIDCTEVNTGLSRLVLTNDHSLYKVVESGCSTVVGDTDKHNVALVKAHADDLVVGDTLLVDNGRNWGGVEDQLIEVATIVLDKAVHVFVEFSNVFSRKILGVNPKVWWKYRNGVYGERLPLKMYNRYKTFLPNPTKLYTEGARGGYVASFIRVSDYAYLLGFYLGDGWFSEGSITFAVGESQVPEFVEYLNNIPNCKSGVSVKKMSGSSEVCLSNSLLVQVLKAVVGDKKCWEKRIPGSWVCSWTEQARRELLRGLNDSDGHLSDRGSYAYTTTSNGLATDIQSLLRSLGVRSGLNVTPPQNGGVINGRQIVGTRTRYVVHYSKNVLDGNNVGHKGIKHTFHHGNLSFTETVVRQVTPCPRPEFVYDLEMTGHPSFVVDGVLSPNSATPKRGDGKEKLFEAHIGPVMVRGTWVPMNPKVLVKQTGWKVPVVNQRDDVDGVWKRQPMKVTPGRMMAVTKAIAASKPRNEEIAKFVKSAYDAGRTIVVMSDLIEDHLNPLFHFIVKAGVPGEHIGFYHGTVKKAELVSNGLNKRVLLATYAMCVWESQDITNPITGVTVPFKKIRDDSLWTLPAVGQSRVVSASEYFPSGYKPCVNIAHAVGGMVVSTDHEVLSEKGWVKASSIQVGDYLVCPRWLDYPEVDIPELSSLDMWLIGAMIGDGCMSHLSTPSFVSADHEIVSRMQEALAVHDMGMKLTPKRFPEYYYRLFNNAGRTGAHTSGWAVSLIRRYGLGVTAKDKHIPLAFMSLPKEKLLHLLAGLFDTDGHVSGGMLSLSALNRALIEQVITLLRRCGYLCSPAKWGGTVWGLSVLSEYTPLLAKDLPLVLSRKRLALEDQSKLSYGVTNLDALPLRYVRELKAALKKKGVPHEDAFEFLSSKGFTPSWLRLGYAGSYRAGLALEAHFQLGEIVPKNKRFSYVEAVTSAGVLTVGDVSVPETQNFICGGSVVHNCSEGTNLPHLDTLVLATPRSNVKQAIGRILRLVEGKKQPVVLDLVDDHSILKSFYYSRLRQYYSVGGTTVEM